MNATRSTQPAPSHFHDMTATAARADQRLDASSRERVRGFISRRQAVGGGFRGRDRVEDLYYSVFGAEAALAIDAPVDAGRFRSFLDSFGDGDGLDFVHLASLARCLAFAPRLISGDAPTTKINQTAVVKRILRRIENRRSPDGGYRSTEDPRAPGSVYAAFLAFLAYRDFQLDPPDISALANFMARQAAADGSFVNDSASPSGSTTTTAAAVVLLAAMNASVGPPTIDHLLERAAPTGGFLAAEQAPTPDLLSTATALYALRTANAEFDELKKRNYDFVESLWNEDGGFSGNAFDEGSDCEFTFYALLALGSLET